jgi:hypothetical protein
MTANAAGLVAKATACSAVTTGGTTTGGNVVVVVVVVEVVDVLVDVVGMGAVVVVSTGNGARVV